MSLGEVSEIYNMLVECINVINGISKAADLVVAKEPAVSNVLTTVKLVERVMIRYLALAQQMGLPKDVNFAISTFSRLVVSARMAQMSINALMLSNPFTALFGVAGIALTTISVIETGGSIIEGY